MGECQKENRLIQVPPVKDSVVEKICIEYFGLNPKCLERLNSYDDKNYRLTRVTPSATNGNLKSVSEEGYILKITNSLDSSTPNLIEGQNALLCHLKSRGLPVPELELSKSGHDLVRVFVNYATNDNEETTGGIHVVRLLHYLPGQILCRVPANADIFYKVGRLLAGVHNALEDFRHPIFDTPPTSQWSLYNFCRVQEFIHAIEDEKRRRLIIEIMAQFKKTIIPLMPTLQTGQIHGDFNEQNILVSQNVGGDFDVCGLLDVGDSHRTCLVFDVAIAVVYMNMLDSSTPLSDVGGHFLAGYTSRKTIPPREVQLLRLCMCARYCQSLVFGRYTYMQNPTPDNEYVLFTQKRGWPQLLELWHLSDEELYESWRRVLLSEYKTENAF